MFHRFHLLEDCSFIKLMLLGYLYFKNQLWILLSNKFPVLSLKTKVTTKETKIILCWLVLCHVKPWAI